jgi:hypothetical protein
MSYPHLEEALEDDLPYVVPRPGSAVRDLLAAVRRQRSPRLVVFGPSRVDDEDLVPAAPAWVRDRLLAMRAAELAVPMSSGVADRVDQLRIELAGASSACPAVDVDGEDTAVPPTGSERVRSIANGLRACSCGNVDVDTIEAALVLERDELTRVGWIELGGPELRARRRMGPGASVESAIAHLAVGPSG